MQDAIDLSLLAGSLELPDNPSHAVQVTKDYWELNGFERDIIEVKVNYKGDPNKIQATSTRTIPLLFMPIFHIYSTDITVSAACEMTTVSVAPPICDYVIFSGSDSTEFRSPGSRNVFDGKVHLNANLEHLGSDDKFNVNLEVTGAINADLSKNYVKALVHPANFVPMPSYSIDELKNKATVVYNGNTNFSNIDINGIIFVDGDVGISGGKITGKGSIIATGKISISASTIEYSTANDAVAFFSLGDIAISGSYLNIDGIFYAPNGKIDMPGSYNTIKGALIANSVVIPGSNNHFLYDERVKELIGVPSKTTTRLIE